MVKELSEGSFCSSTWKGSSIGTLISTCPHQHFLAGFFQNNSNLEFNSGFGSKSNRHLPASDGPFMESSVFGVLLLDLEPDVTAESFAHLDFLEEIGVNTLCDWVFVSNLLSMLLLANSEKFLATFSLYSLVEALYNLIKVKEEITVLSGSCDLWPHVEPFSNQMKLTYP